MFYGGFSRTGRVLAVVLVGITLWALLGTERPKVAISGERSMRVVEEILAARRGALVVTNLGDVYRIAGATQAVVNISTAWGFRDEVKVKDFGPRVIGVVNQGDLVYDNVNRAFTRGDRVDPTTFVPH